MDWFGRIYRARIPDPDGNPIDHDHPVMIFRGPDAAGTVYVIAISTKFEPPAGRLMVECPWAPGGHQDTGLSERCVLKCSWFVKLDIGQLKAFLGTMPLSIANRAAEYVCTAVQEAKSAANRRPQANQ